MIWWFQRIIYQTVAATDATTVVVAVVDDVDVDAATDADASVHDDVGDGANDAVDAAKYDTVSDAATSGTAVDTDFVAKLLLLLLMLILLLLMLLGLTDEKRTQ